MYLMTYGKYAAFALGIFLFSMKNEHTEHVVSSYKILTSATQNSYFRHTHKNINLSNTNNINRYSIDEVSYKKLLMWSGGALAIIIGGLSTYVGLDSNVK